MKQFLEFVDRKNRESKHHLHIISKALASAEFDVVNYINQDDSHIFVRNNSDSAPFEGIRIYEVGDALAYRVQKEQETQPYGKAYLIDLEEMFNDFMSENMNKEKAGRKVIKSLSEEINEFFARSTKAQTAIDGTEKEKVVILKTGGTDYSGTVTSKL